MFFGTIISMALDLYARRELDRMLKKTKYWNMNGDPYPKYMDICEELQCDFDDVKDYKDEHFPDGPTNKKRSWE